MNLWEPFSSKLPYASIKIIIILVMIIINHLIMIIIIKQTFPDVCSMGMSILDSYSVEFS